MISDKHFILSVGGLVLICAHSLALSFSLSMFHPRLGGVGMCLYIDLVRILVFNTHTIETHDDKMRGA